VGIWVAKGTTSKETVETRSYCNIHSLVVKFPELLGIGESVCNFIFLQTKNSLSGVINLAEDFCTHILNGSYYISVVIA
jgi:hypothetical protein